MKNNNDSIQPRIIRMKDAPAYLGMNCHFFNQEVRPSLKELRFGKQGVAFDQLDLDRWVDVYRTSSACPITPRGKLWGKNKQYRGSRNVIGGSGTLIRKSSVSEFAKALAQVASAKRKCT